MKANEDRKAGRTTAANEVLDPVLEQLRREHRTVEAPQHLSTLLQAETERFAFGRRSSNNPLRMAWVWGVSLMLLAGLIWGLAAWERRGAEGNLPREVQSAPHAGPANTAVPPPTVASSDTERQRPDRTWRSVRTKDAEPSMSNFLPLPASEGLPPTFAVSLVRMRITTGALQQYGLEVPEGFTSETLLAEFVVGEDGLPRAIRIVP